MRHCAVLCRNIHHFLTASSFYIIETSKEFLALFSAVHVDTIKGQVKVHVMWVKIVLFMCNIHKYICIFSDF